MIHVIRPLVHYLMLRLRACTDCKGTNTDKTQQTEPSYHFMTFPMGLPTHTHTHSTVHPQMLTNSWYENISVSFQMVSMKISSPPVEDPTVLTPNVKDCNFFNAIINPLWWIERHLIVIIIFVCHQVNSVSWWTFPEFSWYRVRRSGVSFPASGDLMGPWSLSRATPTCSSPKNKDLRTIW